ncbi:MAG: hypothetical protein AAFW83_14490 [Pseudomonadota bacterium]
MHSKTEEIFEKSASELTDDDIKYFIENPQELDLIGDRELVRTRLLRRLLALAVVCITASKAIGFQFGDQLGEFVNGVVVDLVFELGAALLGAVATVYFLEIQQKKQFAENTAFIREVRTRIKSLST